MNRLRKIVRDYVTMRRHLGYKLRRTPVLLNDFVGFLHKQHADYITVSLALQWVQSKSKAPREEWAQRLSCVRCFARHLSAIDGRTQIPPWGLMPFRFKRSRPYLYTDYELQTLLRAAVQIGGLQGQTYYCLIGLLSVAGLRIGEALNLRTKDVDLDGGLLVITGAKFGKSRLVPIHVTTQKALAHYRRQRDKTFRRDLPYFFVSPRGCRLDESGVEDKFRRLTEEIGLRDPNAKRGPRLHDFRHRFAVKTLLAWYRSGEDPRRRLPVLSTYLGHVHVGDTYWYLSACPELMALALRRLKKSRKELL
jgi:integrase